MHATWPAIAKASRVRAVVLVSFTTEGTVFAGLILFARAIPFVERRLRRQQLQLTTSLRRLSGREFESLSTSSSRTRAGQSRPPAATARLTAPSTRHGVDRRQPARRPSARARSKRSAGMPTRSSVAVAGRMGLGRRGSENPAAGCSYGLQTQRAVRLRPAHQMAGASRRLTRRRPCSRFARRHRLV